MAMILCPYCDIEVSMSSVEAEYGCCPECGAIITATAMMIERDEDETEDVVDDHAAELDEDDDDDL
jgi:Zn-finger nucleic acid-binding protein